MIFVRSGKFVVDSSKVWRLPESPMAISQITRKEEEHARMLSSMGITAAEFYQEVEMNAQYVQTHRDVSYARRDVSLHSHGFYELLCCCSTCGMEYLVGTERYRLQKGDIIIVHPGVSHRPIFPEVLTEPYVRNLLWMSQDFVDRLASLFPGHDFHADLNSCLLRTAGTRWEYLETLFERGIRETEEQNPYWKAAVLGNSITLVTELVRALHSGSTDRLQAETPGLVEQVIAYVEQHLAEKITLADIAKVFYVSESTISQTFRKKMGVSFYRCVTQRRLIAAKTMIVHGTALESVSEQVGFTDYSSFYRAFRQEYGISPRDFRMAVRSSAKPGDIE